jgi:MYXO-CTERM domain-containing protein
MERLMRVLVITGLMCAAGNVLAQNTTTLGALQTYATIHAGGVTVAYTGDADSDATGFVEHRVTGVGAFVRGHTLSRISGGRFTVSLLRLAAGTTYEVRVTVTDPDNAGPLTATGTLQTRANTPPVPSGRTLFVDAAVGDDGNPGTEAQPKKSITGAADVAGPGDTVVVFPGVYREQVLPRGGSVNNPLVFRARGDGVILDGAQEDIAAGAATWTSAGNGVWFTSFAGESRYAAFQSTRLYDYQALADLLAGNGNIGMANAIAGGFFVDTTAQRLYVKLPDGSSPQGVGVDVAVLPSAFLVDGVGDVVIEGFEIRHFGSVQYSGVGVDLRDANRCWVRNNVFHHLNTAVRIRRALAHENVVENNTFRDSSVYGWPWASAKAHTPEASAVEVSHGHGNIVRWNDLQGSFNGIYAGAFGDSDEEIARDTDIYENQLAFHGDDGLELEGAVLRVRAWENRMVEVYNAVSLAPVELGPVMLVRNVIQGYQQHAFKVNNGPTGHMFVYHTTAVPLPVARFPDAQAMSPSVPFGGLVMRNNILQANRYVVEYGGTSLLGGVDLDYDALHTVDTTRYVKWLNVRYANMAALAASGTVEVHGFGAAPVYQDVAAGNLALAAGHALLDVGVVVDGVNNSDIVGAGPDIGAFERGGIVPGPDTPFVAVDGGMTTGSSTSSGGSGGSSTAMVSSSTGSGGGTSVMGSSSRALSSSTPAITSSSGGGSGADGGVPAADAGAAVDAPQGPCNCTTANSNAAPGLVLALGLLGLLRRKR